MDDAGCKVQGAWCTEYIPPLKRVRGMFFVVPGVRWSKILPNLPSCLLYTSDDADELLCVDLGGRRIIKKKNNI